MNLDTASGPPDDPDMESRVSKVETELSAIKVDLGVIQASMATKVDIAHVRTEIAEAEARLKSAIVEAEAKLKVTITEAKASVIVWVVSVVVLAQLLPVLLDRLGR